MAAIDAVELEVVKASLSGIVQEMQNSLFRTGFSTIVRESQDASCALMNAKGEVVAQHVVLPLHIGAFPACTSSRRLPTVSRRATPSSSIIRITAAARTRPTSR
jgi:N-methylhydantoinase B/oxoprolinase/acetone carboxylase alpha subunit